MKKKLMIGAGVLVAVLVIGVVLIGANISGIVKAAITEHGSDAMKTEVSVGSVDISIASGAGSITDLSVANPKPFFEGDAIKLGKLALKVDVGSIMGTGPVVIREIGIDGPEITYAMDRSGKNNLQVLQRNIQKYMNSKPAVKKAAEKSEEAKETKPARKVIIRDFYIRNGKVSISYPMMKQPLQTDMPEIHLMNIGEENDGATYEQVAAKIFGEVSRYAGTSSAAAMKSQIKSQMGSVKDLSSGIGKDLKSSIGGLFRK